MAINVEVAKSGNDNNLGLIRKFTKRVQGSGILSPAQQKIQRKKTFRICKKEKNPQKNRGQKQNKRTYKNGQDGRNFRVN